MNENESLKDPLKAMGEAAVAQHGHVQHPSPEGTVVEEVIFIEEIIIVEDFSKENRPIPRAKGYKVRVDKDHLVFHEEYVTGRQILEKAGRLPPEKYILREVCVNGSLEKIGLDERVHLRKHGLEKFRTMLKSASDG